MAEDRVLRWPSNIVKPKRSLKNTKFVAGVNTFSNDGSFLEQFKKKMEAETDKNSPGSSDLGKSNNVNSNTLLSSDKVTEVSSDCTSQETRDDRVTSDQDTRQELEQSGPEKCKKTALLSIVGKRKMKKVLKTGIVMKKQKADSEDYEEADDDALKKDVWSKYLDEVKKYKAQSCEDDSSTRPLVK